MVKQIVKHSKETKFQYDGTYFPSTACRGDRMTRPITDASSHLHMIRWSQDATNALFGTTTGRSGRSYRLVAEETQAGWDWIAWRASQPTVLQSGIASSREDAMQAAERAVTEMDRED